MSLCFKTCRTFERDPSRTLIFWIGNATIVFSSRWPRIAGRMARSPALVNQKTSRHDLFLRHSSRSWGWNPILGRNFTVEDDRRGAAPTVLISEGLWQRKFGRDPGVIGKRLVVGGTGRTIIGVIPASFRLKVQNFRTEDLYVPIGEDHDERFFKRDAMWGTDGIALLKPGVTLKQAREDMARVNGVLAAAYPNVNAGLKSTIVTLKEEIVGDMRLILLVKLLGAIGFVLMIACVNVANLLLARSASRQREFAIRAALGAGQVRITMQLLTEGVALAISGGLLGLAIAKWGTAAAVAAVPRTLPRAEEIGLDGRVLLFTFAISILAGILFGLVPALKSASPKIGESLKAGGRSISGYFRSRMQAAFVIGEMAMAFVLLIGAGLMVRTLLELWRVDPGFDPHHVVTFDIHPPASLADQSPDRFRAFVRQLRSSMHGVPGAEYVSIERGAEPMDGDNETSFWVEGQTPPERQCRPARSRLITWSSQSDAQRHAHSAAARPLHRGCGRRALRAGRGD